MNVHVVRAALVAVSAGLLVACAVETGGVFLTISCEAAACAEGGDLRARVEDCDEDTAFYGDEVVPLASFATSGAIGLEFDNVLAGDRCVQAFLDVDTNGTLSSGDVVSSEAIEQGVGETDDDEDDELDDDPEIDVEVNEDETTDVEMVLDTVVGPIAD